MAHKAIRPFTRLISKRKQRFVDKLWITFSMKEYNEYMRAFFVCLVLLILIPVNVYSQSVDLAYTEIKNAPVEERADMKAEEITIKGIRGSFVTERYNVEILEVDLVEGGLRVQFRANNGVQPIAFGSDGTVEIETLTVINPPVLIDNPEGLIVKLYSNALGVEEEKYFSYDPRGAFLEVLDQVIGRIGKSSKDMQEGKIGRSTLTVYPQAGSGNDTTDAWWWHDDASSWANSRGAVTSDDFGDTQTNNTIQNSNTNNTIMRQAWTFDTSSLGDSVIDSATLSIASYNGTTGNPDDVDMDIVSFDPASDGTFVAGDFEDFGDTPYASENIDGFDSDGTYVDFTLDSNGIDDIETDGMTAFGSRLSPDTDNSAPAGNNYANIYQADETGTTKDPVLVIQYSAPPIDMSTSTPATTDDLVFGISILIFLNSMVFLGLVFKRTIDD